MEALAQQTVEWSQWRKAGIGSSDAPIIMGDSPWETPHGLWQIKTGRKDSFVGNWATAKGNELELKARACYELVQNIEMNPILFEHKEFPYLRASLDGFNKEKNIVLEIKCAGKEDHELALNGQIPTKYQAQLQHQLMVSGASELHYFSFHNDKGQVVQVTHDLEYQKQLLEKEIKFWEMVSNDIEPPLSDEDFLVLTEDRDVKLFETFKSIRAEFDEVTAMYKEMEKKIASILIHPKTECSGVKVTLVTRQGTIDYKKVPELKSIDLEQFRTKASTFYKFTFPKK